jgi:hypothetical protein
MSIHMMAGRMCRSFLSIASTVQLVLSTERPTISSAATPLSPIAFLVAVTRHDHHSSGSCSAQPGRGCCVSNSTLWKTTGVPPESKMPTLTPSVPKSMPRRYGPLAIASSSPLVSVRWRANAVSSFILPAELFL